MAFLSENTDKNGFFTSIYKSFIRKKVILLQKLKFKKIKIEKSLKNTSVGFMLKGIS